MLHTLWLNNIFNELLGSLIALRSQLASQIEFAAFFLRETQFAVKRAQIVKN